VSYTLGRTERLKSRKQINKVFAEGKVFQKFPLRAVVSMEPAASSTEKLQCGFTVSTRNFKKAVLRNRIRRIIKEVYRKKKGELYKVLDDQDQRMEMFLIFTGKEIPSYSDIEDSMDQLLVRIIQYLGGSQPGGPKL
jgi:ribonuclease P protein component